MGRLRRDLHGHFSIFVPTGRAVNPVTGTNRESSGLTPDIAVPAAGALRAAHLDFLRGQLEAATSPPQRARIQSAIEEVEAQ